MYNCQYWSKLLFLQTCIEDNLVIISILQFNIDLNLFLNFRSLLDNQILLEQFLDNEDQDVVVDKVDNAANGKYERNQNRDPEASFLRISSHLRQALKKHFPMVSAKLHKGQKILLSIFLLFNSFAKRMNVFA